MSFFRRILSPKEVESKEVEYPLVQPQQESDYFGSPGPYNEPPYSLTPKYITKKDIYDIELLHAKEGEHAFKVYSGKLKKPVTIELNKKWRHEAGAPVRIFDNTSYPEESYVSLGISPPPVTVGGRRIKKNKTKRFRRRNSNTRKYRV